MAGGARGVAGTALKWAWNAIPFKGFAFWGTVADQGLNRGRITDPIGAKMWSTITDGEERAKAIDGASEGLETVRKKIDGVADFVSGDPLEKTAQAIEERIIGSDTNPDGTKKSFMDRVRDGITGAFTNPDGSRNWTSTIIGGGAGAWLLKKMFSGDNKGSGGGFFAKLVQVGLVAGIGYAIATNFDKVKSMFGGLKDAFGLGDGDKKPSALSSSKYDLNAMDLTPAAPAGRATSLSSDFAGKTMQDPSVTIATPTPAKVLSGKFENISSAPAPQQEANLPEASLRGEFKAGIESAEAATSAAQKKPATGLSGEFETGVSPKETNKHATPATQSPPAMEYEELTH